MTNLEASIKYCNKCISGEIPACTYVVLACQRFLKDLEDPQYFYNDQEVDAVITFIENLNLPEQEKPRKFKLENWQIFILSSIYGLYNKEKNVRKYKYALIEIARKNGKSQFVTALALYHTIFDTDSQVVLSANSVSQVKNVSFKKIKGYCQQLDPKEKHLKQYHSSLKYQGNELIVVATNPSKLDGLSVSYGLVDEVEEAVDNKMYNVIKSSMGARSQPLLLVIGTAGFDTTSFAYELRSYCINVLNGTINDPAQFAIIYTLDEGDEYTNNDVWQKANPNLGVSLNQDFLNSEVLKATQNSIEKSGVLVKNFNLWQKYSEEQWLEEKYIDLALQNISIDDPIFKGVQCYAGVDLASVSDLTCAVIMFYIDDLVYLFPKFWLPEDSVNNNHNKELFKNAALKNELVFSQGNVTDYRLITKYLLEIDKNNHIYNIAYDKWNSVQWAVEATEAGLYLTPYSQTAGNLNKPLKAFEHSIKSKKLIIQNNSLAKFCLMNTRLLVNKMGNYSINKEDRNKKIDFTAASINAVGISIENGSGLMNIW